MLYDVFPTSAARSQSLRIQFPKHIHFTTAVSVSILDAGVTVVGVDGKLSNPVRIPDPFQFPKQLGAEYMSNRASGWCTFLASWGRILGPQS